MKMLTLVNRSSKSLKGTWDGKHYDIDPGRHSFPQFQAEKFKEQNPIMGTLDARTGQAQYLIGIEEYNDDCSPIEQSTVIERWDRKSVGGPDIEVVKAKGGLFQHEKQTPLPVENAFVKP